MTVNRIGGESYDRFEAAYLGLPAEKRHAAAENADLAPEPSYAIVGNVKTVPAILLVISFVCYLVTNLLFAAFLSFLLTRYMEISGARVELSGWHAGPCQFGRALAAEEALVTTSHTITLSYFGTTGDAQSIYGLMEIFRCWGLDVRLAPHLSISRAEADLARLENHDVGGASISLSEFARFNHAFVQSGMGVTTAAINIPAGGVCRVRLFDAEGILPITVGSEIIDFINAVLLRKVLRPTSVLPARLKVCHTFVDRTKSCPGRPCQI